MATTGVEVPEDADSDGLFVDTNILVYANVASAPLHEAALTALTSAHEAGRTLWISRQVLREFAATRLRPQSFAEATAPEIVIQRLRGGRRDRRRDPDAVRVTRRDFHRRQAGA